MAKPSKQTIIKGHCPECGSDRNAAVVGFHEVLWEDDGVSGGQEYRILRCEGCGTVYFQTSSYSTEELAEEWIDELNSYESTPKMHISYWPPPILRPIPQWTLLVSDRVLRRLLREMYAALNSDLRVLTAIGARTAFDRASELLGVDERLPFRQKLDALVRAGKISTGEKDTLTILIDAGGAAAHRAWRPEKDDLSTMIDVVEALLHREFHLPKQVKALKEAVPPKAPQPKKPKGKP